VEWLVCRTAEVVPVNQVDGTPLAPEAILQAVAEAGGRTGCGVAAGRTA
jgi:Ni,Fe-hydrogenase III small subunit